MASLRATSAPSCDSVWENEDVLVIADRYVIEERIGHGASGSIYRAHDRLLERPVALKLLGPGALGEAENEARLLAAVDHRNVVTIHDLGRDRGRRYLVLELLDGPSLRRWLASGVRDQATILDHFIEAGRGLAAAHAAGVVHRDFKPDNVLFDARARVVVVDFGLAEAATSSLVCTSPAPLAQGTVAYMAPEQLDGAPSNALSDQFSFCVALWEALAGGRNPFDGDDPPSRHRSICAGPRPGLSAPSHVVACLERGLHPDPRQRFESMDALLAALEARPRQAPRRRHLNPLALAASSLLAFFIGWGVASGSLDAAGDDPSGAGDDSRLDAAAAFLADADRLAHAGQAEAAIDQLIAVRQLASDLEPRHPGYCKLGHQVPPIAEALAGAEQPDGARIGYALALRFAQDCPELDAAALLAKREALRETSWMSQRLP